MKKLWTNVLLILTLVFTMTGFTACDALEDIGGMLGNVAEPYSENIEYVVHGMSGPNIEVEAYDVAGYKDGEAGGKVLKIPETYKGKPVVKILGDAFKEQSMEKVILPSSIKSIGQRAFENCLQLKEVQLSEGLEEIYPRAFMGCENLVSVNLPTTLTMLNSFAFFGTGLKSVVIPKNITKLGMDGCVFRDCKSLESVTYQEGAITTGEYFFVGCTSLKNVTLPSSMEKIGVGTFADCTRLERLEIPASVTVIEENAFTNCVNLTVYAEATEKPEGWTAFENTVKYGKANW